MAHSIEMPYAIIPKESADRNLWGTVNALTGLDWYRFDSDAMQEAGAETAGKSFVCADGKLKLTPVKMSDGADGYLVEDIHNYAS